MSLTEHLWVLALALALDALVGDPDWLWRRLPHPVVVMGSLIGAFDRAWNRDGLGRAGRRTAGAAALIVLIAMVAAIGWLAELLLLSIAYGWVGLALAAAVLLAGRSLYDHVAAVAVAYESDGIGAARRAVAKIVGRDPEHLNEAAISRATIESVAENFSDGLVAPAFWFALLGLPGILAYKVINTADSMIGHRTPRHRDFGWAAARLDDLVNWLPARLSVLPIAISAPLAAGRIRTAFQVVGNDARKHRSPNAGRPEAAMAGALGIALSGPRSYGGAPGDEPFINETGIPAGIQDIGRALRVYAGAWAVVFLAVVLLTVAFA